MCFLENDNAFSLVTLRVLCLYCYLYVLFTFLKSEALTLAASISFLRLSVQFVHKGDTERPTRWYFKHEYIHTYIHACMHASIHPSIHPSIHTCMHACIHTYIHTYMHACMHTYIHTYIHTYLHVCIYIYSVRNKVLFHAPLGCIHIKTVHPGFFLCTPLVYYNDN